MMSVKARAIRTLYRAKRITIKGIRQAVSDGLITENEYTMIVGTTY